ncbi:MAG TPA: NADH-quinone oxidoreductase subunit N [Thermomicrobiales bacterium]|jgi:NADH-quinone oxidoreductase subunit N|nr:NADH-quinone oxidoreductase subunit N [Thermomicrobiales bacterium]
MPLNLDAPSWGLLIPSLIVLVTAVVVSMMDAFMPKDRQYSTITIASLLGYGLALVAVFATEDDKGETFHGLFRADGLTVFLSIIILVSAILTVLISASYVENLEGRMPIGEFYTLVAFATFGAMITGAAGDMVMVYIGIELTSIATYVLTAFARRRATALEGALKYFLLGLFASAILLYGMAWIYGSTGSTNLDAIASSLAAQVSGQDSLDASLLLGLLLVIVGLAFKMAAVPFHFWTPDAYDGAPTPVTGWMSVVPKAAAFAATVRMLIQGLEPLVDDWRILIAALAFITMIFGNIVAVSQRDVKRMLAYSSIAHTGYMMAGFAAYQVTEGFGTGSTNDLSVSSVLYYLLSYTLMNIGAFAIIVWIQHRGRGYQLEDFYGLGSSHPGAAAAMTVFMVSLMGIPPTIGFYAKYYVIVALLDADLLWLAITIVLTSAVSAFYYLRVVAVMYFQEGTESKRAFSTPLLNAGILIMVIGVFAMGLFSGSIIDLADNWTDALTIVASTTP